MQNNATTTTARAAYSLKPGDEVRLPGQRGWHTITDLPYQGGLLGSAKRGTVLTTGRNKTVVTNNTDITCRN